MRNQQLIVRWLLANTHAIEERQDGSRTYHVMIDREDFRQGCIKLMLEIHRIRSQHDYGAAKRLFDTYGTPSELYPREELVARMAKLNGLVGKLCEAEAFVIAAPQPAAAKE